MFNSCLGHGKRVTTIHFKSILENIKYRVNIMEIEYLNCGIRVKNPVNALKSTEFNK